MKDFLFWNKWSAQTRILYVIALGVFIASMSYMAYSHFVGVESLMEWETEYSIKNKSTQIDVFKNKLFEIPVMAENFVVLQHFKPSLIKVSYTSATIFILLMSFASCLGLTVISTYKKLIWFIPGTALFAGWLASFKMDLLAIYGFENEMAIGVMLISYLAVTYLFHSIFTKVTFLFRFLSFVALTAVFAVIINQGAVIEHPFLHLSNYGLIIPGIITFIFLIIIGNEILQVGLSVITYSKSSNPWSVPTNFTVLTLLYVGYLLLYYVTSQGIWVLRIDNQIVELDFKFNAYLFMGICGVLGIWSHRKRSILYKNILPFAPGGAFLYLVFAIISFATVGYVLSISITPVIEIFEYVFLALQISLGVAFFAYAFRNFFKPMIHSMPIYKMIYDPRLTPHYVMRGLGLVIFMFFIGPKLYKFRDGLKSARFSLVGDTYFSQSGNEVENRLAKYNYNEALTYYKGGSHASYSLASLYLKDNEHEKGWHILNTMREDEKSEFAYAILSSSLKDNFNEMLGHFVLNDAVKKFPDNPYIANNVAMSFYDLGQVDSAVYYLSKNLNSELKNVLESNALGVAALEGYEDFGVIDVGENRLNDLVYKTNAYALSNVSNTPLSVSDEVFEFDTLLSGVELSYLNNYVNSKIGSVPEKVISTLRTHLDNLVYDPNSNNARVALAKALFFNGELKEGLKLSEKVTSYAAEAQVPYYSNFTGLLALRMNDKQKANKYLGQANQMLQLVPENFARFNSAIASLEVGDTANASSQFLALSILEEKPEYKAIYEALKGDTVSSELHKACYLLYHPDATKKNYLPLVRQISSKDLQVVCALNLLEKELDANHIESVDKLWEFIPPGINDEFLYKKLNLLNLRSTHKAKNFTGLKESLSKLELDKLDNRWKKYFEAQVSHYTSNDTLKTSSLYEEIVKEFPHKEEIWTEYVTYLEANGDFEKAYNVCTDYLINNEDTKEMLIKYVDLSVKTGVLTVAEETVLELEGYMDASEYQEFKTSYENRVEALFEESLEE